MNAGILSSYTVDTNTATQGDPKLHSAARQAKTHDSTLVLGQNFRGLIAANEIAKVSF